MALTDYMSNEVAGAYSTGTTSYGAGGFMESAKGLFGDVTDLLGDGLQSWVEFEKVKGQVESYGQSQEQARQTAQVPSGTRQYANPATAGLPNLSGQQLLIAGGVILLAVYLLK